MNKDYDKLLQYALRMLAKKRYTSHEMDTKLRAYCEKKEISLGYIIQDVMARLIDLKYINDEQFVKDYITDRLNFKPRGLKLMKQELYAKGIDEKAFDKCVDNIDVDEVSMAVRLLEKKGASFDKLSATQKKQKAFTFLYSKGFFTDTIYKALINCYDLK